MTRKEGWRAPSARNGGSPYQTEQSSRAGAGPARAIRLLRTNVVRKKYRAIIKMEVAVILWADSEEEARRAADRLESIEAIECSECITSEVEEIEDLT